MASAPNVDGMVDIRSYAIFQDVSYNQDECAPGVEIAGARGPFYRGFTHVIMTKMNPANARIGPVTGPCKSEALVQPLQPVPTNLSPFFTVEEEQVPPPPVYDTHHSWLCCFCSVAVVFVVFGTIFSYAALHEQIRLTYNLSNTQSILVGAGCFAMFVLVGPLATRVIKSLGFRSTAVFGLLLVFIGLILEGFITNVILFYMSRLVLIPIGGGLSHTASHYMSSFFEEQIMFAVLILCCCSILGVISYSWFAITLQSIMSYKGIHVVFGLIVLFLMTVTHAFPIKLNKVVTAEATMSRNLKHCIKSKVRQDVMKKAGKEVTDYNEDATVELKSCLCVCVCEMSIVCNRGFFLWAGITMLASLTVTVPYLFLYVFHSRLTVLGLRDSRLKLILAFSIPNLLGRVFLIFYNNHTFSFNRLVFQFALTGTGIIMIFFSRVETYGWLAVWMLGMGLFQGLMNVTIPRLTLQTVSREWLKRAWILIIILDALGSFIGPALLILLRYAHFTTEFKLPTVVIGILQLVAMLLTLLIPNDEDNYNAPPAENNEGSGPARHQV